MKQIFLLCKRDSNGAEDTKTDTGDASVQQADVSDVTVQQDAIQIEEQPKSQATDVPNGAVFDPDLMATMMAAVARIQDTTSREESSEFVQERSSTLDDSLAHSAS